MSLHPSFRRASPRASLPVVAPRLAVLPVSSWRFPSPRHASAPYVASPRHASTPYVASPRRASPPLNAPAPASRCPSSRLIPPLRFSLSPPPH
ncbi:unnamed protein product, partial [Closterium sp. Naga37s-1]